MNGDKTIIITGATGGIGSSLAFSLVQEGYSLILACRDIKKGEKLKNEIFNNNFNSNIDIIHLDISCTSSIHQFKKEIADKKIWALINNAGIISANFTISTYGYELNSATNLIGPYLLSSLLKENIVKDGCIINVISCTAKISSIDLSYLKEIRGEMKSYNRLISYGKSKLALLYVSYMMLQRFKDINIYTADPGIVNTSMISMGSWYDKLADIFFRPFIKSTEKGAMPILRALHFKDHQKKKELKVFRGKNSICFLSLKAKEYEIASKLWDFLENIK